MMQRKAWRSKALRILMAKAARWHVLRNTRGTAPEITHEDVLAPCFLDAALTVDRSCDADGLRVRRVSVHYLHAIHQHKVSRHQRCRDDCGRSDAWNSRILRCGGSRRCLDTLRFRLRSYRQWRLFS